MWIQNPPTILRLTKYFPTGLGRSLWDPAEKKLSTTPRIRGEVEEKNSPKHRTKGFPGVPITNLKFLVLRRSTVATGEKAVEVMYTDSAANRLGVTFYLVVIHLGKKAHIYPVALETIYLGSSLGLNKHTSAAKKIRVSYSTEHCIGLSYMVTPLT